MLKLSPVRRGVITVALGLLLASVAAVGAATPASADDPGIMARPTDCHYEKMSTWGSAAWCNNHNGGSFRALVNCKHGNGDIRQYLGYWKQWGTSYAYCQGDSNAIAAGIETSVRNHT